MGWFLRRAGRSSNLRGCDWTACQVALFSSTECFFGKVWSHLEKRVSFAWSVTECRRAWKCLKPRHLNVLASDESGVLQELRIPPAASKIRPLAAHWQPQSSAHARFIHLHDPSNAETFWTTRVEGNFGRAGEASLLSDVQERMKWALRVRTRAPFCLCQGVGGRQPVFVPFGRYRPPHVCRGRSRILRYRLSPSLARRLLRQDSH